MVLKQLAGQHMSKSEVQVSSCPELAETRAHCAQWRLDRQMERPPPR
eukprot:CAMPEP_0183482818 /NCGR_PEP_ID=MMETSP0370-20130417/177327_1 /TAXON_ID=268820 /ORGANISM="Peridinium aciculiferum, Strain PAER-2" /LENGTH=46 /DNA_ID= /DNA_START= /DNA_END= /DNA_ORIENTATION=